MEKAIVTGGAGFIGSHMVDLLLHEGFSVVVIDNMSVGQLSNLAHHADNPNLEIRTMDIRALKANSFEGAKYVFHFAGIGDLVPSIEKPKEYMDVNVQGTVCVLEAAREARIKKLVYAASSSCYGLAATPTTEETPTAPEHPYAFSKYLGELACFHWAKIYGLPLNTIRLFNAYGTRSRTTGAYGAVMGVFLKQKLENKPFTVVGDGTQKRDFIYVTDVVKAFYLAATTHLTGETFNLGGGNPQSVNRLVELLGGETVHLPKRPGEPDITYADISKIKDKLGFTPLISFEEGVSKVLDNIEYWENAPLWDEESIAQSTKTWFEFLKKGSEVNA